jgi:DNA-binding phage protein
MAEEFTPTPAETGLDQEALAPLKSSVDPGTKKRTNRFINTAYKRVRRATGIDPIKESARLKREMDKALYKNLNALVDPDKRETLLAYLNDLDTQFHKRLKRFYNTLQMYAYARGELRALRYIGPFISDEEEERERLEAKAKKELKRGKGSS